MKKSLKSQKHILLNEGEVKHMQLIQQLYFFQIKSF